MSEGVGGEGGLFGLLGFPWLIVRFAVDDLSNIGVRMTGRCCMMQAFGFVEMTEKFNQQVKQLLQDRKQEENSTINEQQQPTEAKYINNIVFSIAVDGSMARLIVSWRDEECRYSV
jgi:hypothetical protein